MTLPSDAHDEVLTRPTRSRPGFARWVAILPLVASAAGCGGLVRAATITVNATGKLLDGAAEVLREVCVRGPQREVDASRTQAEAIARLDQLEQRCRSAAKTYSGVRVAHMGLVLAVKAAELDGVPPADLPERVRKLGQLGVELVRAVELLQAGAPAAPAPPASSAAPTSRPKDPP